MKELIQNYITNISNYYSTGETTEHSFRGEFKTLCEETLNVELQRSKRRAHAELYRLINEPRRKTYGAPDYELLKGDTAVAFIEAKNIGDSDLRGTNSKKNKSQFDRYKSAISTIAFTDYLTIILYEEGVEVLSSCIGSVVDGKIVFNNDDIQIDNFKKIMQHLGKAEPQPIRSAIALADKMAKKAKLVASILQNAMNVVVEERTDEDNDLWGKLKTFQEFLVHDMTEAQFVDFYAQTILYGLFIARINDDTPETFSLTEAAELIPSINPFLKKIFKELALAHLHPYVKGIVEDLVLVFKRTDMPKLLKKYRKDPLVHFYEDFLEAYNPKIREEFGVWYTPNEVVEFIVNGVDYILRNDLHIEDGLANNSKVDDWHKVQILDPATGTGTFLATTANKIYENYVGQEGLWNDDVVNHIIPRMNGFEYLMAPYTMAHLKLATALKLEQNSNVLPERLNIFLTNSLEEDHPEETFDFARYITDEANAASVIKRDTPIMVVMGNPPYNEKSANKSGWIMNLMDDYKQEPGQTKKVIRRTRNGKPLFKNTLDEVNAKGINNDYCKFIRLGHNFVKKTQEGVLAYICGNTFTKTNIFRGMRYELLRDFDDIYIINLHGSSKFDETNGELKDENIFNIMVGVSINIFIRRKDCSHDKLATVHYKDIFGSRKEKLEFLHSHNLQDVDFQRVKPEAPYYELCPKSDSHATLKDVYNQGFKIDAIMIGKVQGFTTEKDKLAIKSTKREIVSLLEDMLSEISDEDISEKYDFKNTKEWNWRTARTSIKKCQHRENYITEVCYRPFDNQWTFLHKDLVGRPRPLIQTSMMGKNNVVLCIGKQGAAIGNNEWSLVYISSLPTDKNVIPRGGTYLFPLFIYDDMGMCLPNFSHAEIVTFENKLGLHLQGAEDTERIENGFLGIDLINYIYAVLHSTRYRKAFHEFLQNDFPVIPYPSDADYFFKMAEFGCKLSKLHSLTDISKSDFITKFPISEGDNIVSERTFEDCGDNKGKVWINAHRYFEDVPLATWQLYISGYQPLDKWLKDRIGTKLSGDDICHFQKMVVALHETINIMTQIDALIEINV
jgi:type I restriction-modification system DNA methylase subunit